MTSGAGAVLSVTVFRIFLHREGWAAARKRHRCTYAPETKRLYERLLFRHFDTLTLKEKPESPPCRKALHINPHSLRFSALREATR